MTTVDTRRYVVPGTTERVMFKDINWSSDYAQSRFDGETSDPARAEIVTSLVKDQGCYYHAALLDIDYPCTVTDNKVLMVALPKKPSARKVTALRDAMVEIGMVKDITNQGVNLRITFGVATPTVVASTTFGHHHLYIDDVLMPWDQYVMLLKRLKDVRLIEKGYYKAARRRRYSAVRLPWVPKRIR